MNHERLWFKKLIIGNDEEMSVSDICHKIKNNKHSNTRIGYITVGDLAVLRFDIYRRYFLELHLYHKYDSFGEWYYKDWLYFVTQFRDFNICKCERLEALNLNTEGVKINNVDLKVIYFGQNLITPNRN